MGLFENLDEAYTAKQRAEAATDADRRILTAKFPKLWQSLRQRVEDAVAGFNRR